ncbi:MAG: leucine zipper domain-containing protein [Bacteroidota bacterium]|nr:leucine zipper domain-containing protein [Bacteroidota bacterium]
MFHHTEKLENYQPPASNIFHPRLAWMLYYKQVQSVAKVCEKFCISRKTFYKWWNRYYKSGYSQNSLIDESRKPHTSPLATPKYIVKKIIEAKLLTGYGQRRLRNYLIENHNINLSEHTIWKLLKQNLVNAELSLDNTPDIHLIKQPGEMK